VRFLRRGSSTTDTKDAEATDTGEESAQSHIRRGYTPKKGRPTPSRREAENKRRGPVPPPPKTTREAIKRSRELRKSNPVSKEELKALRRERRERMLAGDERYLAPHDRGPVKAFARDCVDSRRNLLGLFMPLALVMFVSTVIGNVAVQQIITMLCMVLLLAMLMEAFYNGRRIARLAREKFPKETIKGRSLGWYCFIRATQFRKLRIPRPRVKPGDEIPL